MSPFLEFLKNRYIYPGLSYSISCSGVVLDTFYYCLIVLPKIYRVDLTT